VGHVVLLGDSIFDNARYVPGRPAVVDQLGRALPPSWRASLLAVDGHVTESIALQLKKLPTDATHLVVSAGGNDALGEISLLNEPASTIGEALSLFHDAYVRFRDAYRRMLEVLSAVGKPTVVCTVYDAIPDLGPGEQAALAGFNALILREAFLVGLPVIDLRLVCGHPSDYSPLSSIEPSSLGGAKITRVIAEVVTAHDFGCRRSIIYV
jgi:hypothetical protein